MSFKLKQKEATQTLCFCRIIETNYFLLLLWKLFVLVVIIEFINYYVVLHSFGDEQAWQTGASRQ